jgi:hypothetical protein
MPRTVALFIALMAMAAVVQAQAPATSFDELARRLSIGETVFMTNRAGKTVKGQVQRVSDTILVLRSGSDDLTLTASDVQRISRRGHAIRNGALIGLASGFIIGGIVAARADDCTYTCFSSPAGVLAFGGLFGSIGMGIGAGMGASFRREQVVFAAIPAGSGQAPISSLLPPGGAGIRVQIS